MKTTELSKIFADISQKANNPFECTPLQESETLCANLSNTFEKLYEHGTWIPTEINRAYNNLQKLLISGNISIDEKRMADHFLESSFDLYLLAIQHNKLFYGLKDQFNELAESFGKQQFNQG